MRNLGGDRRDVVTQDPGPLIDATIHYVPQGLQAPMKLATRNGFHEIIEHTAAKRPYRESFGMLQCQKNDGYLGKFNLRLSQQIQIVVIRVVHIEANAIYRFASDHLLDSIYVMTNYNFTAFCKRDRKFRVFHGNGPIDPQ
jgi:hypothetical protein